MGRIARVVAEGLPHHITQRGNGRQVVFDDDKDRRVYLKLLRGYAEAYRLRMWAWCLMSNHVHLLAVPETSESLKRTLGQTTPITPSIATRNWRRAGTFGNVDTTPVRWTKQGSGE